jgi:hypothetical protein
MTQWWEEGTEQRGEGGTGSSQNAWQKLAQGKTIGKKANIAITAATSNSPRTNNFNILQIGSSNEDALQLCITLNPPTFIPATQFPGAVLPTQGAIQDATGDRNNYSFLIASSPSQSWGQPTALVEWGIGGVQTQVECDFSNGLVLNICASWVRVSIFTDVLHEQTPTDGILVLGAFIGPGYPKANNAQRTFVVGLVNAENVGNPLGYPLLPYDSVLSVGSPNMYPIPFYAKQATLMTQSLIAYDFTLIFYRDNFGAFRMSDVRFTDTQREPAIVPNGSMYFSVHNNTNVLNLVNVVFDLAV